MYADILKRDLKRKKAMNIILLVFVILATMFVSSSVNNIINVTTALDEYFELANVPDYCAFTINKMVDEDVDGAIKSAESIEDYKKEEILFLSYSNIIFEEDKVAIEGSNMLQSDKVFGMNYILSDGSILEEVKPGEIYLTDGKAKSIGVKKGEKIVINIENVSREFTFVDTVKDAALGSEMNSMCRYIISEEDYNYLAADETINKLYGGCIYFIQTDDLKGTKRELSSVSEAFTLVADWDMFKLTYLMDMIATGVLLVVSIVLILIAFIVLRFTIAFTLAEEFREIGVMKAIGIKTSKIRSLYLIKYSAISVIGALIGLGLSFPFGKTLISVTPDFVVMSNQSPVVVNAICAVVVVGIIMLFCYGCTNKVNKMSPIDAIRNGQTGERFKKKTVLSLGKSRLSSPVFLAVNDIVSSPKRFGIITLTYLLCLLLLLILSIGEITMKSKKMAKVFGFSNFDVTLVFKDASIDYLTDRGRELMIRDLEEVEAVLNENGMNANCAQEVLFSLPVIYEGNQSNVVVYQGIGNEIGQYEYIEGIAPESIDEIAITRITSKKTGAGIGDTVTLKTTDGEMDFIITAIFQSMLNQGDGIRVHEDVELNYIESQGALSMQVYFTDKPNAKEIANRMDRIEDLFPDVMSVDTCEHFVEECFGASETVNTIKTMVTILTVVLTILVTVLMERSFIIKEQSEIALMKAIGTTNIKIYAYHTLRILFVGIVAIVLSEIIVMPVTHLCLDPIYKMMGMELAMDYVINPMEMFMVFPLIILVVPAVSAFVTSLYTRIIKSWDMANAE